MLSIYALSLWRQLAACAELIAAASHHLISLLCPPGGAKCKVQSAKQLVQIWWGG